LFDDAPRSADAWRLGAPAVSHAPVRLIVFAVSGAGVDAGALGARLAQWAGADVCVTSLAEHPAPACAPPEASRAGREASPLRVAIASARAAVFRAAHGQLSGAPLVHSIRPVTDTAQLRELLEGGAVDLLMLDETLLRHLDEVDAGLLRRRAADLHILLLCDKEPGCEPVLSRGMCGCLAIEAPPGTWLRAVAAVGRGELWLPRAMLQQAAIAAARSSATALRLEGLTPRERQTVGLVREGLSNKQIARRLGIGEDTVKKHLQNVFAKLGVHRRALVALGWVGPDSP
jgi:DNA-binding NarL/FixJ family response regulator